MSMQTYAASDWLVSLTQLKAALHKRVNDQGAITLLSRLEDPDLDITESLDDIETWVNDWLVSKGMPLTDRPFISTDTEAPELEEGELYFSFGFADLFTKTETAEHKALLAASIVPEFNRWTIWG